MGGLFGYLPFTFDSSTDQCILGTRWTLIYSNFALLLQISISAVSVSIDKSLEIGFKNLDRTAEFVTLISGSSFYLFMFAIPLSSFFKRHQILKSLNKILVLRRFCVSLNGSTSLTSHILHRLYGKFCFDLIVTVIVATLLVSFTDTELGFLIFHFFYSLFCAFIENFLTNVFCLSFYFYGYFVEVICTVLKKKETEMSGDAVELECLTNNYWSILIAFQKLARIMEHILLVSVLACFLGIVWAVGFYLIIG